jgi:hypothetical protein
VAAPHQLLAGTTELPAFERGQLVGEFVDLGLAVQDVAVALSDDLALLGDLGNQLGAEFAQLFGVQMLE